MYKEQIGKHLKEICEGKREADMELISICDKNLRWKEYRIWNGQGSTIKLGWNHPYPNETDLRWNNYMKFVIYVCVKSGN